MSKTITLADLKETTIFSVVPFQGGKIGIRNTAPKERFEVNDPISRELTPANSWTNGGNPSNIYDAFFYAEGSRIWLQGRLNLEANETYTVNGIVPIAQLPSGYRPLKEFYAFASCRFTTNSSTETWTSCNLIFRTNGQIMIERLGLDQVANSFTGTTDSAPPLGSNAFYVNLDNISYLYKQAVTV